MPAGVACTKFRKNPTFKTIVMLLRSSETLNRVFLISQKWNLPGSSTKPFNYNEYYVELSLIYSRDLDVCYKLTGSGLKPLEYGFGEE